MTALDEAHAMPLFVHEVTFLEDAFILKFTEDREASETVSLEKAMILFASTEQRQQVYLRLQEDLQWLIDDGFVELRNPEQEFSGQQGEV